LILHFLIFLLYKMGVLNEKRCKTPIIDAKKNKQKVIADLTPRHTYLPIMHSMVLSISKLIKFLLFLETEFFIFIKYITYFIKNCNEKL